MCAVKEWGVGGGGLKLSIKCILLNVYLFMRNEDCGGCVGNSGVKIGENARHDPTGPPRVTMIVVPRRALV